MELQCLLRISWILVVFACASVSAQISPTNTGSINNSVRLPVLLDNLQLRGLIPRGDPCQSINCGPGRYCTQVPMGSSTVQTYQCRLLPAQPLAALPAVPKCFDTFTIKVPATALQSQQFAAARGSSRQGQVQNSVPCRSDCVDNSSCTKYGPGYSCCLRGCDRVCYLPRTTSIDYTNY